MLRCATCGTKIPGGASRGTCPGPLKSPWHLICHRRLAKVLSNMLQGWMMKRINDEQGVHNEVDMWTPVLSRKRPPQTLHYERILPKQGP